VLMREQSGRPGTILDVADHISPAFVRASGRGIGFRGHVLSRSAGQLGEDLVHARVVLCARQEVGAVCPAAPLLRVPGVHLRPPAHR
jgi:hypothetical protein